MILMNSSKFLKMLADQMLKKYQKHGQKKWNMKKVEWKKYCNHNIPKNWRKQMRKKNKIQFQMH